VTSESKHKNLCEHAHKIRLHTLITGSYFAFFLGPT